jgi:acyl-CoA thioesterase-2
MELSEILTLEFHGRDTFVGVGPEYPWGGLYGGQIVAQALMAASATVEDDGLRVHSLRSYFIRMGDHHEPVRYEVDRLRNGRSFATRRVVARQATGAILNLEASFQRQEESFDLQTRWPPEGISAPEDLAETSWSGAFRRAAVPPEQLPVDPRGAGRSASWFRCAPCSDEPALHAAAFAYISDDLPTDAVHAAHPVRLLPEEQRWENLFNASLDHTIWFHRPFRVDEWHLHEFECTRFVGSRGLTFGAVFDRAGVHVATVTQEVLLRETGKRSGSDAG